MNSNDMSMAEYIKVHPNNYESITKAQQAGLISWDTMTELLIKLAHTDGF